MTPEQQPRADMEAALDWLTGRRDIPDWIKAVIDRLPEHSGKTRETVRLGWLMAQRRSEEEDR